MTYSELLVKRLKATGTALEVIVLIEDYLEHGLSGPAWTLGFDGVLEAADQYRRSKRFSVSRFCKRFNAGQRARLEQEAGGIRRALKEGHHTKKAKQSMVARLTELERIVGKQTKQKL